MEVFQAGQEEDWLLDSLEKYEELYMFELQYPTSSLEWVKDGSAVWVVCAGKEATSSEILQLALPEKLLAPEKQTLWAKRDFKLINGTLVESRVTCLKCITNTECVVSANTDAKIQTWSSNPQTPDLLVKVDEMELDGASTGSILLDTSPAHPYLLLTGASDSLHSLNVLDINSKKSIFRLSPCSHDDGGSVHLHTLSFLDGEEGGASMMVTCSGLGCIDVWDFRSSSSSSVACAKGDPLPTHYSLATSNEPYPSSQLALLASNGRVCLYDNRKLQSPLSSCLVSTTDRGRFTGNLGSPSLCVKYSPINAHVLSCSGVGKGIEIHHTTTWSCDTSDPTPLFVHGGHEIECPDAGVLVHSWQPGVHGQSLLSTDSQASLHAWQWNKTTTMDPA